MISQIVHNVRAETVDGRKYLVAPITMIVPGVLNGSAGAFLYSLNELARTVDAWNGLPITWKHPHDSRLSGDFPPSGKNRVSTSSQRPRHQQANR